MSVVSPSVAAQALNERIENGGFAISLSGGGHRATLATLGALMAIVDRGLSPKVMQIASVSGGSITIPVIALLKSLVQTTQILNANTVLPRVDAIKKAFERRNGNFVRPNHLDPADLLVDLRELEDFAFDYNMATLSTEDISKTDPAVKEWEKAALARIRLARDRHGLSFVPSQTRS